MQNVICDEVTASMKVTPSDRRSICAEVFIANISQKKLLVCVMVVCNRWYGLVADSVLALDHVPRHHRGEE